jgi:hypothetical protein
MTKQEWDRQCKAIADAEWARAHGTARQNGKCVSVTLAAEESSRQAATAARAVKDASESLVLARFMQRAAVEKRARAAALVSHSVNGSIETLDRWNATMGRYQALG